LIWRSVLFGMHFAIGEISIAWAFICPGKLPIQHPGCQLTLTASD